MLKNICAVVLAIFALSGCSAYMAATQPSHKNLSVFNKGNSRKSVIAEVGNPTETHLAKNGYRVDLYRFKQGRQAAFNAGRAVAHGAADVMTLGLWEVIGTPAEIAMKAQTMTVEVEYDSHNRVNKVRKIG